VGGGLVVLFLDQFFGLILHRVEGFGGVALPAKFQPIQRFPSHETVLRVVTGADRRDYGLDPSGRGSVLGRTTRHANRMPRRFPDGQTYRASLPPEARERPGARVPLAEVITRVRPKPLETPGLPRGPADLDRNGFVGGPQAEVEARVAGRLVTAAAEPPGGLT